MPKNIEVKRNKKKDKKRRTFEKFGKNTSKGLRKKLEMQAKQHNAQNIKKPLTQ